MRGASVSSARRPAKDSSPFYTDAMRSEDQTMKSAVSPGIGLILWISVVICALSGLALMFERSFLLWNLGLVTLLVGSALPLWMLLATGYRLEKHQIVARSGPFRWRVRYADIRHIEHSNTPLAGPALSMNRLVITYGDFGLLLVISPKSPVEFKDALQARVDAARQQTSD